MRCINTFDQALVNYCIRQVSYVTATQEQRVSRQRRAPFTPHVILACFVMWICNLPCGLLALILAGKLHCKL